jgi:hypothetical protein
MTLLAMALALDTMIVVSDQRLTLPSGKATSDRANKAIMDLRSGTAFAYTGIAQVGALPTDEWIMTTLAAGPSPTESLINLRDQATVAFARMRYAREIKRLAIVGAGWATFASGTGELEPFLVNVSNFDGRDRWLPAAQSEFTIRFFYPDRDENGVRRHPALASGIWTAGQDLKASRMNALARQLKRAIERTGSVRDAARVVAEHVRSFAAVNQRVGRGLVVVMLPKPREGLLGGIGTPLPPLNPGSLADHFGDLTITGPTFLYVPPDLSAPAAAYGPLVIDDNMRFQGIEVWAEQPPWWSNPGST